MLSVINAFIALLLLGLLLSAIAIFREKQEFNNGICPECYRKMRYFDTDSQGGRGYICTKCKRVVWVSWPGVDKDRSVAY